MVKGTDTSAKIKERMSQQTAERRKSSADVNVGVNRFKVCTQKNESLFMFSEIKRLQQTRKELHDPTDP